MTGPSTAGGFAPHVLREYAVGNWVNKQFQLDALGEALLLFAAAARHGRLDSGAWRAARIAADAITARWREPDAGIWEIGDQEWTHSRLACSAGLRAGPRAGRPGCTPRNTTWRSGSCAACHRRSCTR